MKHIVSYGTRLFWGRLTGMNALMVSMFLAQHVLMILLQHVIFPFILWHYHLGNLSSKWLDLLKIVLPLAYAASHTTCSICPFAKIISAFIQIIMLLTMCLICYIVMCGVLWSSLSCSGYLYLFTLVDDKSRFTWVYIMRQTSDVLSIIPRFFQLVDTQFNKTFKVLRSDNAPELNFSNFFCFKRNTTSIFLCRETSTKFFINANISSSPQCCSSWCLFLVSRIY